MTYILTPVSDTESFQLHVDQSIRSRTLWHATPYSTPLTWLRPVGYPVVGCGADFIPEPQMLHPIGKLIGIGYMALVPRKMKWRLSIKAQLMESCSFMLIHLCAVLYLTFEFHQNKSILYTKTNCSLWGYESYFDYGLTLICSMILLLELNDISKDVCPAECLTVSARMRL